MSGLLGDLVGTGARRYDSFKEFLVKEVGTDKGRFSFAGRRPVEAMVDKLDEVMSKRIADVEFVIHKGAQTGISTLNVGTATFVPAMMRMNAGYYLPTQEFAERFGATRFSAAIRRSQVLQGMMRDGAHQGVNTKGLKEFNGRFLYSLGLESVVSAISIPLDAMFYDEVDVIPAENMEWSDDRIAASDWRFRMYFCVPMFPGSGIDKLFQDTCRYQWLVRCSACNTDHILEDEFPRNVKRFEGGSYGFICTKCGKAIDRDLEGRYVAENPEAERDHRYGFRLSQLALSAIDLGYIMRRWEKAKESKSKLAKFRCSTLAKPDAGDRQPITDAVLQGVSADYHMELGVGSLPRFAGVDTGNQVHLAVHELLPDGRKRYIWFEDIDGDQAQGRINELWARLGLSGLVIDYKPLTNLARGLTYDHPGQVWVQNFYGGEELQEDTFEHMGKEIPRVKANRDTSLDDFTGMFSVEPSQVLLPAVTSESPAVLDQVHLQLKMLQKEKVEDARGNVAYRYRKNVANHFGMAMNSSIICEYLAVARLFGQGPVEYQSVQQRRWSGDKGAW